MSFFGLISKKEHDQTLAEIAALKQQIEKLPDWVLATAGAEKYNLLDTSLYEGQAELYRSLAWVAQCVDVLSITVPLVKFHVARKVSGKEPREIPNHPFTALLEHPNPLDSRSEFLSGTAAAYRLHGNGYWYLNSKDEFTPPDELWNIPPNMITPIPDEKMYIKGYMYYPGNGMEIFLEPHQIVHFRRYNPFSRIVGMSLLESLRLQTAGALGMIGWNARLWGENNGRLPGILLFEQMIENGIWTKIKEDTREASKKRELLMLRGTGGGGVKWIANALPQKDMEFLEGLANTKKDIQDTLTPGLSVWLSGSATYSNAGAARAAYNELTLQPMLNDIAQKVTNEILPDYPGRPLVGYFDDVRISDKQMILAEQTEYSKTHTINMINEKYYQSDEIFDDERGDLLPSQIQATSGVEDEEPTVTPAPLYGMTQTGDEQDTAEDEMGIENETPEAEPDTTETALQAELSRFERKALNPNRIGKAVEFTSTILPAGVLRSVGFKLLSCDSETAVKAVFEQARATLHPSYKFSSLADSINRYVDLMEKNATH